jgi:hypothetical protein
MTVATEVKFKKKTCSSQRDFYFRYKAKVCKPDGIQHRTHYTMIVWDVVTGGVLDCTLIMEAAGSSETLVFMYKTIHFQYPKNASSLFINRLFRNVQVAVIFYYEVIECVVEFHLHTVLRALMAWYIGTKVN